MAVNVPILKSAAPANPWTSVRKGQRFRPWEWAAEKGIFLVATTTILAIFLIFLFVGREALPIFLGKADSSQTRQTIPPERMDTLSPAQLQAYLGLTKREFEEFDRETLLALMEVKVEAAAEMSSDADALINSVSWRYLLRPFEWSDYDEPRYIWQPISPVPKYNIVPLIIGSLKATFVALAVAVPLALGAAIFVSQLAAPRLRETLKPAIEMLAGIPSVVLGAFAYLTMASVLQAVFGYTSRLNAFVAGVALSFAVIPVIFSIAEDSLTSVPRSYTQAALALGSSRWHAAWHIVLPAALPGVFAAVVLGFGRALGETMIVLLASGNASIVSMSLFDSARTITATIAAEILEAVVGSIHYRMLFFIGALLFLVTFLSNLAGEWVIFRLKDRLEGKAR